MREIHFHTPIDLKLQVVTTYISQILYYIISYLNFNQVILGRLSREVKIWYLAQQMEFS